MSAKLIKYVAGRKITGPDVLQVKLHISSADGTCLPYLIFDNIAEAGSYVSKLVSDPQLAGWKITISYEIQETVSL